MLLPHRVALLVAVMIFTSSPVHAEGLEGWFCVPLSRSSYGTPTPEAPTPTPRFYREPSWTRSHPTSGAGNPLPWGA